MMDVKKFHHLLIYQINNVYNLWCFNAYYAVLLQNLLILQFTLFCRKICFVAIYALLRGEKLSQKWIGGEKMTNMRYVSLPPSKAFLRLN